MPVYIVGAGPAGMTAAIAAADSGHKVIIIDKNEKIGKKLYITGKGRCNLTNRADFNEFLDNVVTNKRFLYSALRRFDSEKAIELIESAGVHLKTERGKRVFPESDKSSDIIKAFSRLLKARGVDVRLNETVSSVIVKDKKVVQLQTDKALYDDVDAVVVATGGISYPLTGSTGDGYVFAKECGLNVVEPVPALTGLYVRALNTFNGAISFDKLPKIQGISLKNVKLTAKTGNKLLSEEFGEMLFTERGLSGPIAITTSSKINRIKTQIELTLDLKPALDEETLDKRLLREFDENKNKALKNVLLSLVPSGLVPIIILSSCIDGEKKSNSISKEERKRILKSLKSLSFSFGGLEGFERAVVTSGGVDVSEINPSTMVCKKISNLYFAGEVLDIDALTGGFNIQIALSTGYCAGSNI